MAQRCWEQATLLTASVVICFATDRRISQAVTFATLKKFVFLRRWAL